MLPKGFPKRFFHYCSWTIFSRVNGKFSKKNNTIYCFFQLIQKNSWNTPEGHWFISIYQKIITNVAERLSVRYNESNSNKDSSSESREKSDGFYIKSGKLIYSLFTSGVFEVHSSWRVMRAALLFLRKNEHFFKKLSPKVSFFSRLLKKLMFSFSFYLTSTKNSRY